MSVVWRGLHVDQGVYVAVKIMTGDRAMDPRFLDAFRNEVRAMAGLDHPGIVRLFDFGQVPDGLDPNLGLRRGAPYLVMELLEGGSLARYRQGLAWEPLLKVLRTVLDALGHAHARGVVHRDLKPENILMGLGSVDAGLKISDFGLAHAMDFGRAEDSGLSMIQGTPAYMAPEQFLANWRDYGPWTDLYALGCLGWALATGVPPFGRQEDLRGFRQAHSKKTPPRLNSKFPVPEGYEPWLRRLLAKRPQHRFRRAADARLALDAMGEPTTAESEVTAPGSADASADEDRSQTKPILRTTTLEWPPVGTTDESHRTPVVHPSPPSDWRVTAPGDPTHSIDGVSLAVFGLREFPVLGRASEQDVLWRQLCRVHELARAEVAVLHGPAGCGRSHLARWFARRADEVGAALVLRADHHPDREGGSGLAGMLERHLRTQGLRRSDVLERVEEALHDLGIRDEAEAHALTELIRPADKRDLLAGARRVQFRSQTERHILVERLVVRLARERPVLLWLEDIECGPDSLAFVSALLARQRDRALMIVATVQADQLAARPASEQLLQQLVAQTDATQLLIGPLSSRAQRSLIREQLGLEGDLADRVEERTAGNPMFAIQLVNDWMHRGVLEPGATGFRLRAGAQPELPMNLVAVWTARLAELLHDRPPGHGRALELAAVLGIAVGDQDWAEACRFAGLEPTPTLVETLCTLRLATREPTENRWCFVHAMLRESLLRNARVGGRLVRYHRACAEMLRAAPGRTSPERLGRHLLAAGDREGALGPLLLGIQDQLQGGDTHTAGRLLRLWDKALADLALPQDDTRHGAGWMEHARHDRLAKNLQGAQTYADRVETAARQHGWQRLLAEALREQARLARLRGQPDRAWDLIVQAGDKAGQTSDRRFQADCDWELGHLLVDRGNLEAAGKSFQKANVTYQTLKDGSGRGDCETGLAVIARQGMAIKEARRRLDRASKHYGRSGSRWGVAETFIHRGDVDRLAGDLDLARANYQEARERYQALGVEDHALLDQREALLLLERGRPVLARPLLNACLATFKSQQRVVLEACTHVFLLPCAGNGEDWQAWDLHFTRAQTLLSATGYFEVDLARMARNAGHYARRLHKPDEAMDAYSLSLRQWSGLGLSAEIEELKASLRALT
jgi:serine/threonine protein kinase/tetratricopeptide (TPR) repeat protein